MTQISGIRSRIIVRIGVIYATLFIANRRCLHSKSNTYTFLHLTIGEIIMTKTTSNPGQFTKWHMERAGDNRYSNSDQTTKPAAGERSKTLVTDGRPAGTHFRANPWHDGGAGNRGARASELAKYNGSSYEKQSANDAPPKTYP